MYNINKYNALYENYNNMKSNYDKLGKAFNKIKKLMIYKMKIILKTEN